jgi:hypothetical protein
MFHALTLRPHDEAMCVSLLTPKMVHHILENQSTLLEDSTNDIAMMYVLV